jgi:hypothetical protein
MLIDERFLHKMVIWCIQMSYLSIRWAKLKTCGSLNGLNICIPIYIVITFLIDQNKLVIIRILFKPLKSQ